MTLTVPAPVTVSVLPARVAGPETIENVTGNPEEVVADSSKLSPTVLVGNGEKMTV